VALDIIKQYFVLDHNVSYLSQDSRNQFVLLFRVYNSHAPRPLLVLLHFF